jgi:type II secretory pathway pseudopilin PulG
MVGTIWSAAQQREKERELLFVGEQFRQAIKRYYDRTPGLIKQYPQNLDELLKDSRYLTAQRYLRKIYFDPITSKTKWGIVKHLGGGIEGVYSLSNAKPIKSSNFSKSNIEFEGKLTYSDWKFIYTPQQAALSGKSVPDRVNSK